MSGIPLAFGSSLRRAGQFPEIRTVNLFAEQTSSNQEKGLALLARPGWDVLADIGDTSIRGIFYQAGLFDGDALVVAGTTLYRVASNTTVTAMTGTIPGGERVVIAAGLNSDGDSEARIANGSAMFVFDGVTVTSESFAEDNAAIDVHYAAGQWLGVPTNSQELYVRYISDASWDALTFASAEYKPDLLVKVYAIGGQVMAFGSSSTEVFALTGVPANPLEPLGLKWPIGCMARDSVAEVGGALCMVSSDAQVYRFSPQPQVISDPGLTEQLRQAQPNTFRAWSYTLDGHAFYVLTCSEGTWVWDGALWSQFKSKDYAYWRAHIGAQVGTRILAADAVPGSGKIFRLSPDALTEDGEGITREFTAWLEIKEGQIVVDNLVVNCAVGEGPRSGQGSAPILQLRCSRDGGKTFSGWREASMPLTGDYSRQVRLNRWGTFKAPGALFQGRISDPVPVRVTDIRANVP